MKLYGKYSSEPCHCCGKPATAKLYELPICLGCARLEYRCREIIKRGVREHEKMSNVRN